MRCIGRLTQRLFGLGQAHAKQSLPAVILQNHLAGILLLAACAFPNPSPAGDGVVISEFMAAKQAVVQDDFGNYPDWLEIYNGGAAAVSLGGWHLTDDPADPNKWTFPATNLPANGFLLVYCSGTNRAVAGLPLHTSFALSASGEYLALVRPDGSIASEFAPTFPQQFDLISYGQRQSLQTTALISNNSPVRVWIPTSSALGTNWLGLAYNDTTWTAGTNGVGYENSVPGWLVKLYKGNGTISSLAAAESVIATPALQAAVFQENRNVVDYFNSGSAAHYGNDYPIPGYTSDQEDYVIEATGTVTIPSAGNWTFGVNSDDGFSLKVGNFTTACDCLRGPGDTLATFNFPAAGEYPIRLVFFERGGGSEVEVFAAAGSFGVWDAVNFRLVGDTANGGLAVRSLAVGQTSFRSAIKTDVQSKMYQANATAYIRLPFTVANPAALTTLTLRMQYDDGFVAWLNGTLVASRNAPAAPVWNSSATASRPNDQALRFENFDLTPFLSQVRTGANVLAIQGLNDNAGGQEFFIAAELAQYTVTGSSNVYFASPTPGNFNSTNLYNRVADTKFSHDRGFYDTNFNLVISCATPGATIRYTTNGSVPSLTNGLTYAAPIPISQTICVRAAAFKTGMDPSDVDTHTYIFVRDVINQSPSGQAPTAEWPAPRTSGGQVYDYGMDPQVVTNPLYAGTLTNDLKAIPTISLVMTLGDLFDPATGIYANPSGDTIAWERPGSVELIHPNGAEGFHANCGVRIRGGYSRSTDNPKHAFRLFFRQEYGLSKLKYPLFGSEGAAVFDKVDLRCAQNYSWSYGGDSRGIFIRDQFSRDVMGAMGHATSHGFFFHLYLNGQYWGLYNIDERPEAAFGETYFGGSETNYDTIKVSPDNGYTIGATDGNLDAWLALWRAATNGFAADADYQRVQGNNPDGTRNPAYPVLLDAANLIDYMLVIFYSGNLDAPVSAFLGNTSPNNWYGVRDRTGNLGWRFIPHDSEHTLLNVNEDRTGPFAAGDPAQGSTFDKSSPQYIFQRLCANAEFRMLVADRVQKHCFNNGPLSPKGACALFMKRKNEIDRAVVCESARWGDAKREPPLTRDIEWVNEIANVTNNFIAARIPILLNQLKADNLYPAVNPPDFSTNGGLVPIGYTLTLTNPNGLGTIYYTLDGADPRLRGGAIAPTALAYTGPVTLYTHRHVRARVKNGAVWSALQEFTFYTAQDYSKLVISELMYHPPAFGAVAEDEAEFLELKNLGNETLDLSGLYFSEGITFAFPSGTLLAPGRFLVLGRNVAALQAKYPGLVVDGVYTGKLDNSGETLRLSHILGGEVLRLTYNDRAPWPAAADGHDFSMVRKDAAAAVDPDNGANWRASAAPGGSPGAEDPAPTLPAVVINEFLSHSVPPQVDAIELYNPTASTVDLSGWFLTDDPAVPMKFRIPDGTTLAPGGYRVFDETQFNPTPGTNLSFSLSSRGEQLYLFSGTAGGTNLTGYSHGVSFGAAAAGVTFGRHLTSVGEEHFPAQLAATLGAANAGPRVGPVVINEIMYHPPPGYDEYLELRNVSDSDVLLYDPAAPTNTWKLEGVGFQFPQNSFLPAHAYAIVTAIEPATFRAKYGVPAQVQVFGPYAGLLQGNGERLQLQRPDAPDTNGVPYITVDAVRYNDKLPWPVSADGDGPSLQRRGSLAYGDDPANWFASGITPGLSNAFNSAPAVSLTGPAPGAVFRLPTNITLQATAADPDGSILRVEFLDGPNLIGLDTTPPYELAWPAATVGSHVLTARAWDNGLAVTESAPVTISVTPPPIGQGTGLFGEYWDDLNFAGLRVTRVDPTVNFNWGSGQPHSSIGAETFSVRWTGFVQPRYSGTHTFYTTSDDGIRLWVNGQLVINNWTDHGSTENLGFIDLIAGQWYDLKLEFYENGGGATATLSWSATGLNKEIIPATQLYPATAPVIVTQPQSQSASAGMNITFTVTANGTPPLAYQWRFNGAAIPGATSSSYTIFNAQGIHAGSYTVTISNQVGVVTSAPATLSFQSNVAPVLNAIPSQMAAVSNRLAFTAIATDADLPPQTLTFSLDTGAPSGAAINPTNGLFTWTPSTAQANTTYVITVRVTDNGSPAMSAARSFSVKVAPLNHPPVLAAIPDWTVTEGQPLIFTNTATDANLPGQTLVFSLDAGAPVGVSLDPTNGVFSWTPGETHGGSNYLITVRVTDNGLPVYGDAKTFAVTVVEDNHPPVMTSVPDQTVAEQQTFLIQLETTDPDLPAQNVAFSLVDGPTNAAATSNGLFTWRPGETDGPGSYVIRIRVTDDGVPPACTTNAFTLTVREVNQPPMLDILPDRLLTPLIPFSFAVTATDGDWPPQQLAFTLDAGAPPGAAITPEGVFTWTPSLDQAHTTNVLTVRVTDNGSPPLDASRSFVAVVGDTNSPPVLAPISNRLALVGVPLRLALVAADANLPGQVLSFALEPGAPTNALLDSATGDLVFVPTAEQEGATNRLTVVVTDNGQPPLSATQTFLVAVVSSNTAPLPQAQSVTLTEETPAEMVLGALTNEWGEPLQYVVLAGPRHGALEPTGPNSFRYTPAPNFNGTDRLVFAISAGDFLSDTAEVVLDVSPVNDVAPYVFAPPVNTLVGSQPVALAAGDFNRDGKADVVAATAASVSFLKGDGAGNLIWIDDLEMPGDPTAIVAGDFNRDGRLDFAVALGASNAVAIVLGGGDGHFATPMIHPAGRTASALATGDFNRDARPDLALANLADNTLNLFVGDGVGGMTLAGTYAAGPAPAAVAVGDFNKDTRADVAVANFGDDTVTVRLGSGTGLLSNAVHYAVGQGPRAIIAADLNNDGRADLATANHADGTVSVLLVGVNGLFSPAATYPIGSRPTAILATDFNKDGWPDLVVTDEADSSVKVLLGSGGGAFTNFYFDSGVFVPVGAFPSGLTTNDFNKDGNLDLAVALRGADAVAVLLNNHTPKAYPEKVRVWEDTPLSYRLRGTTGPLHYSIRATPTNGTLTGTPPEVVYRPAPNAVGRDRLDYAVDDGTLTSAVARVEFLILPVNDPPSFDLATNLVVVPEDSGTVRWYNFAGNISRGPADEARQSLKFVVSADNAALFTTQPTLNLAGLLTFAAKRNAFGEANVTVQAQDGGGTLYGGQNLSLPRTFRIRVENVNDAPTLGAALSQTTYEDREATWSLAVSDLESAPAALAFTVTSTNATLVPPSAIIVENQGGTRLVRIQPAANEFGRTLLTFTLSDGTNSASRSASLIVTSVNDPPTFELLTNQIAARALPLLYTNAVINLATASRGPANEPAQTLRYLVTNSRPDLFTTPPYIDTKGQLIFKPGLATGTVILGVSAKDSGGTAYGGVDTSAAKYITVRLIP